MQGWRRSFVGKKRKHGGLGLHIFFALFEIETILHSKVKGL